MGGGGHGVEAIGKGVESLPSDSPWLPWTPEEDSPLLGPVAPIPNCCASPGKARLFTGLSVPSAHRGGEGRGPRPFPWRLPRKMHMHPITM